MIKVSLIAAAALAASATSAPAYYYNGQHHPRHAGIGRHGHVIGQREFGRPHGGARATRAFQDFGIKQNASDGAYTRGYTVVR